MCHGLAATCLQKYSLKCVSLGCVILCADVQKALKHMDFRFRGLGLDGPYLNKQKLRFFSLGKIFMAKANGLSMSFG